MDDRIEDLRERRERAALGGGEDRIESQHEKGKMTARERVDYFLDDGTFTSSTGSAPTGTTISEWRNSRFRATVSSRDTAR